ncbi:MAG: RES domain-containing protein [Treponema sp.]|nr:RES domain-containing protein [Treponema sp.]
MLDLNEYEYSNIPKQYLNKIRKCLVSCFCDQPYDKEDDEYYFVDGQQYEFNELLYELNIPEKWYDKIYETVKCPVCGNDLDAFTDVCVDFTLGEQEKYNKILNQIAEKSKPKIEEFYSFLCKYPYLGASHKTGKALINNIDSLDTVSIKNKEWYRARLSADSKIFNKKDMFPPPQNVAITEGRFNHYGQSHFYLGESENLCASECSHNESCICWMQRIRIKEINNILDLTKQYYEYYNNTNKIKKTDLPLAIAGLLLSGKITECQKNNNCWKPEYFVPRFIADVCKEKGIKGILYPSAISFGTNLVIFDFIESDYEFEGEPYLYTYKYEEPLF